jgi:hypothetical protein
MRNLTVLLCDKLQKCWLCRHTFMANSPLVAIGDGVAHLGTTVYDTQAYYEPCRLDCKALGVNDSSLDGH